MHSVIRLSFNIHHLIFKSIISIPSSLVQSVENQLLVVFNRLLQVANSDVLVITVSNENTAWSIQVSSVVALEVRNVRAVIDNNLIKS